MKYTELLNDEDIQYICKAISGKNEASSECVSR